MENKKKHKSPQRRKATKKEKVFSEGEESSTREKESSEEFRKKEAREVLPGKSAARIDEITNSFPFWKLAPVSDKSEDWPMFISSLETSTKVCGFSDLKNLTRLQQCLEWEILNAVKRRLFLSKFVPKVVEILRMLYGRPG